MNWNESVQIQAPYTLWEEKTYVGAGPILVQRPAVFGRVRQSGSAVAVGKWKREPSPAYNFDIAEPQVTLTDVNEVEKQTTWSFEQFFSDSRGNPLSTNSLGAFDPSFLTREFQDNNYYRIGGKLPNQPAVKN